MPYEVFFGPELYISDNNKNWSKERVKVMHGEHEATARRVTDSDLPLMHPINLHHFAHQEFAKSTPALKRWFLTAFVAPEDQHLLLPAKNPLPIEAELNEINNILNQPASQGDEKTLAELRTKLLKLFKMDSWIGVGLKMVDEGKISIDMLNTLIQWQAGVEQFGEAPFIVQNAAKTPFDKNVFKDSSKVTLLQTCFATLSLDIDTIMNSRWGQINDAFEKERDNPNWGNPPTLKNFSGSNISAYSDVDTQNKRLNFHLPSAPLLEHDVVNIHKCHDIPLFSFGFLAYEDFAAAAFFGGRPMQAYLPGAKGNLYNAHGGYYGESLITQHDYVHTHVYRLDEPEAIDKITFHKRIQIYAIIANALVRNSDNTALKGYEKFTDIANRIIDTASITSFSFHWDGYIIKILPGELPQVRSNFLQMFYNEMAMATGITLDKPFVCRPLSNDKQKFELEATVNGQAVSFTFEIDPKKHFETQFSDNLSKDFDKLKAMAVQQQTATSKVSRVTDTSNKPSTPSSENKKKNDGYSLI